MVVSGSVRSLLLAALVLAGCQKKEAAPAAPVKAPVMEAEAVPTTTRAAAADIPEPEEPPCKGCTVDLDRRVSGLWQPARCMPANTADVVYPVAGPRVQVLSGVQKGETFDVTPSAPAFVKGDVFAGQVVAGAQPEGWTEAQLIIKDDTGAWCRSALAIQH